MLYSTLLYSTLLLFFVQYLICGVCVMVLFNRNSCDELREEDVVDGDEDSGGTSVLRGDGVDQHRQNAHNDDGEEQPRRELL